ncbi:MAG: hypothetical protein PHU47_00165 [Candidatus ainarchaeum sp.]|nr:hypothetical protein [Candidatus ainarchaeum sp.]
MVLAKAKPKAVIDTSFWIHLVKLNLVEEFIELWNIVITRKVEEELQAFVRIKLYTPLDLEIYTDLKSKEIIKIKDPKAIPKEINSQITSDSGELYSIALAKEEKIIVFIDNGIPYDFCKINNILVANNIDFSLKLVEDNKLTKEEVLNKLNILEKSKSMKLKYIEIGRKMLLNK